MKRWHLIIALIITLIWSAISRSAPVGTLPLSNANRLHDKFIEKPISSSDGKALTYVNTSGGRYRHVSFTVNTSALATKARMTLESTARQAHSARTDNPHNTTAAQVGAPTIAKMTNESTARSHITPNTIFGIPTSSKYPLFKSSGGFDWKRPLEACVDVFDGAPGATGATGATGQSGSNGKNALFCNISAPVRGFVYDSSTTGLNPSPAIQAMTAQLWFGNIRVIPTIWSWWTGGTNNHVYGSGTSSTFTPSVYSQYSGHSSNNYVAVQVKYSSAATGKQYCTTGIPIAVTKQGTIGPQGPQGANATVTETAVISAFAPASNNTLVLSETSAGTFKLKFKDSNGFERAGITGTGKILHMDTAGVTRFVYDPATHTFAVYNASGKPILKTYTAGGGKVVIGG